MNPVWIALGVACFLWFGFVAWLFFFGREPKPRRVLLYSGGIAVREWRVERVSWCAGFVSFYDPATNGKVIVGGAGVVIEEIA